CYQHYSGYTF
nr:immunoglobulin light chain junction region [Macaca mulatta]